MSHIFISYSKRNRDYARKVVNFLLDNGFDVWIDNDKIEYGVNWWEAIVQAITQSSAFVVIMTPEAKTSDWVQREVFIALNLQKPLFPLLLNGDNWELFVLTQYIDVTNNILPSPEFVTRLSSYVTPSVNRGLNVGVLPSQVEANHPTGGEIDVPALIVEFYRAYRSREWGIAQNILGKIRASGEDTDPFSTEAYEAKLQSAIQLANEASKKYAIFRTVIENEPSKQLLTSFQSFLQTYSDFGDPEQLEIKLRRTIKAQTPFRIAVVGEFNSGKSTLINAILGRDLLAVSWKPTTATLTTVRYGVPERMRVSFAPETDLEPLLLDGENLVEEIKKYTSMLGAREEEILRSILDDETFFKARAQNVEIWLDVDRLREWDLEIVDTPGLGSIYSKRFETVVYKAAQEADVIMYIFPADHGIEENDPFLVLIRELVNKTIFVMSKIDTLSDLNELQLRMNSNQAAIFTQTGFKPDEIFPVFARQALEGYVRSELPSGMLELLEEISILRLSQY